MKGSKLLRLRLLQAAGEDVADEEGFSSDGQVDQARSQHDVKRPCKQLRRWIGSRHKSKLEHESSDWCALGLSLLKDSEEEDKTKENMLHAITSGLVSFISAVIFYGVMFYIVEVFPSKSPPCKARRCNAFRRCSSLPLYGSCVIFQMSVLFIKDDAERRTRKQQDQYQSCIGR